MDAGMSRNEAAAVLESIVAKGVTLWSRDGQLRYQGPRGALTQEDLGALKISRNEILALLEDGWHPKERVPIQVRSRKSPLVPLSFSQMAHWTLFRLGERRVMRQIASAMRMRGRLNCEVLRESVAYVVERQPALRTRIVMTDGQPMQQVDESITCALKIRDMSAVPGERREAEVGNAIRQFLLDSIDVTSDPLAAFELLKLHDEEHVLLLAMEHIIADAFSRNILWRDLMKAYQQLAAGREVFLPEIAVPFADYADSQQRSRQPLIERNRGYWDKYLIGCNRLRFPQEARSSGDGPRWGHVPVLIGREMRVALRERCRLRHTTLAMGVFAAYVGLALRWCGASEAVIQYVSDGRVGYGTENTIGYFACVHYVRVELFQEDTLGSLLDRVVRRYCEAFQHADYSYLRTLDPRPECTRNPVFNWIPSGVRIDGEASAGGLECSPVTYEHPMLKDLDVDLEPSLRLYDGEDGITGGLHFPVDRCPAMSMERFQAALMGFIKELLRQPETRVKDIPLS